MAAPPWPARRIVEPSRTPAGMFTSIVFGLRTCPAPPHVGHGLLSFTPEPPHVGQVSTACNCNERRPPRCASSSESSSSASTSCPRLLRPPLVDLPARPNKSPKSKPPAPPKVLKSKSLKSKPPGGGPPVVLFAPSHPGGGAPAPALTARQFSPY